MAHAAAVDPEGYYRTLGIPPSAEHEAIVIAYRNKAKVLHPDVPGTGNTGRFMELQAAYEVLGSRKRREAYDRGAREAPAASPPPSPRSPSNAPYAAPPPHFFVPDDMADTPQSANRRSRLPVAMWLGLAALLASGGVVGMVRLFDGDGGPRPSGVPVLPPQTAAPEPDPGPSAASAVAPGPATSYVVPSAATDDAALWRYDAGRGGFVPTGRIAPFAPVQVLRTVSGGGMAEIRQSSGQVGFIEASRLVPGDAVAARGANCTFNAGLPPENAEILRRGARGPFGVRVENRQDMPVVVQLRGSGGTLAIEVFVAARATAALPALPGGLYDVQVASGEFWSRGCSTFTAAMRAQRRPESVEVGPVAARVTIPREADGADIADAAFRKD